MAARAEDACAADAENVAGKVHLRGLGREIRDLAEIEVTEHIVAHGVIERGGFRGIAGNELARL